MSEVTVAQTLWTSTLNVLRDQISDSVWHAVFNGTTGLYLDENCLTISVPNGFVRERIEQRYRELVIAAIADAGHPSLGLEIRVDEPAASYEEIDESLTAMTNDALGVSSSPVVHVGPGPAGNDLNGSAPTLPGLGDTPAPPVAAPAGGGAAGNLNAKYTFESFVIGESNRFAHAAALSVAERPAQAYNPLFIYGGAGLGKTHLLQAIAHYVAKIYPDYVVRYISTETLLNEFIDAIRKTRQTEFKARYRDIDVLLVDDVQFMEGKEQLQEEFFHTFNTLHQANRQIVLSSDRPPDAVATLEDRLRSRFKMGLVTDIQPPNFETRLAILRKKAEQGNTPIPSAVLEFISTHVTNNIRELEGALNRVTAFAALNRTELTLQDAEKVLDDIVNRYKRQITPALIMETTAKRFNFTVAELQAQDRRRPLVLARQIAMYLFRELTELSYPDIAKEFGGRDHTTIIYGYDKIKSLMTERQSVYDDVQSLIQQIKTG